MGRVLFYEVLDYLGVVEELEAVLGETLLELGDGLESKFG
jgi:hypothetical protein